MTGTKAGFRTEHDSMGEVQVPADALWGAQTQRAVQNFPVSGETLHPVLIRSLVSIKGCAAVINNDGRAWTYLPDDPVCPDGQLAPSYPLDAPQPGTWSFHS